MKNLLIGSVLLGTLTLAGLAWVENGSEINEASAKESAPPVTFCFAPGTTEDYIEQVMRNAVEPDLGLYRLGSRWSSTTVSGSGLLQGDPTVITWSIVPDGTFIPGSAGEPAAPSNLVAWLNSIYPGGQNEWFPIFETIFTRWAGLSGTSYVFEQNDDGAAFPGSPGATGVRGDVRVAAHFIDGNSGILAYNFFPDTGDMVIDSFDSFYNNQGSNSLGLRNVLTHEHGHGMGFSHVCPVEQTKLMEPFVSFAFDGPQPDDILAVNRGYGDRNEHNDNQNDATSLGTLGLGTSTTEDVSLDGLSDQDYYRFEIAEPMTLGMTLTPTGSTYLEGPQVGGSCTPGTSYNSLALSNPAFEILNGSGTVLATADDNPAGQSESVADIALNQAGTYFVRVFPAQGANDDVQMYDFSMTLAKGGLPCVYGNVLEAWNSDVVSCLGSNLTILDILDAIATGQITPP